MDRVITFHDWFADAYRRVTGRRISFPSNTDPTKTYQYRSVKKFAERVAEWNISDGAVKFLIEEVIKYSKEQRLLSRGVAVLNKADLLEECYGRMQNYMEQFSQLLTEIAANHAFFQENKHNALTSRRGGYPNFVLWYQSGKLSEEYLALSKTCLRLIGRERSTQLPGLVDLMLVRTRLLENSTLKHHLRDILGEDLHEN